MTKNATRTSSSDKGTIKNADVPSETAGLPGIGEGASGAHYVRDVVLPSDAEDPEARKKAREAPPHSDGDRA